MRSQRYVLGHCYFWRYMVGYQLILRGFFQHRMLRSTRYKSRPGLNTLDTLAIDPRRYSKCMPK